jgi:hypothetical protein
MPVPQRQNPSLQLYYKTQTAYCFSTNCNTHGKAIDVIDFKLYYEKCTKHAAILKAQEILAVPKAERIGKAIKKAENIINPGAATTQATATTLRQAQGSTKEKGMFLERMFNPHSGCRKKLVVTRCNYTFLYKQICNLLLSRNFILWERPFRYGIKSCLIF